jgi:hypothetical protein
MSSLDIFTAAATALNRLTARLAHVDEVDDDDLEAIHAINLGLMLGQKLAAQVELINTMNEGKDEDEIDNTARVLRLVVDEEDE